MQTLLMFHSEGEDASKCCTLEKIQDGSSHQAIAASSYKALNMVLSTPRTSMHIEQDHHRGPGIQ